MTDEKIITYFYAVQILTNNGALQGPSDGDISLIEMKSGIEKPKDSDIKAKIDELEAEWTANQFQRDRQYPQLGAQLDLLFHDMTAGKGTKDGEWYKAVLKVKTDNPKPE